MIRRDSFLGQVILGLQGRWPDRTAETPEQRARAICATCDDPVDEWVTITWQLTRRCVGRTDGKEYVDLCMTCALTLKDKIQGAVDDVINAHREYLKGGAR